jgi:hypothetical protein
MCPFMSRQPLRRDVLELLVPNLHVVALMLVPKPKVSLDFKEGLHLWTCTLSMGWLSLHYDVKHVIEALTPFYLAG